MLGLEEGWTLNGVPARMLGLEEGWTPNGVPTRTLGPKGGWIGGPTLIGEENECQNAGPEGGWDCKISYQLGGDRNIPYKGVETSP